MTDRILHCTVSYRESGVDIIRTYAVREDVARELDRYVRKPEGKNLQAWLEQKGCKLDSSGGPAFVRRDADGGTEEHYYRDGIKHREIGPATLRRYADGGRAEKYYREGKRHRENGPAVVIRYADGATCEEYYLGGVKHREDGPSCVWRDANGTSVERYFQGRISGLYAIAHREAA